MSNILTYVLIALFLASVWASYQTKEEYKKGNESIVRENARQKRLIKWLCNDLPTHEACEGYQEEARLNK